MLPLEYNWGIVSQVEYHYGKNSVLNKTKLFFEDDRSTYKTVIVTFEVPTMIVTIKQNRLLDSYDLLSSG